MSGVRVEAVDATGAGDAFTGAMLAELCTGRPLEQAVRFANAAAGPLDARLWRHRAASRAGGGRGVSRSGLTPLHVAVPSN